MKKKKVIAVENVPVKLPIVGSIAWYLLLDKFNAPLWLYGAIGTLFGLVWIVSIIDIWNQERLDIMN